MSTDGSPHSTDSDHPSLHRRRFVHAGVATALVGIAGCLSDDGNGADDSSDGDDANESDTDPADSADGDTESTADSADEDDDESAEDDTDHDREDELIGVINTFLEAAAEDDLDTLDEVSHSLNPLNPAAWVEEGWEFQGGDDEEFDDELFDTEVITDDGTIEDILDLEGAELWFAEVDLEDEIGDEEIALVELSDDDPAENDSIWALVTEDDEWRVFFQAEVDDPPENPEEVFEDEVIDEDDDVVVEIDWEHDSSMSDVTQAAVVLTDSRGIEAERVRVESTIAGGRNEVYDRDDDDFTATWTGVTLYVQFDPNGDQIVVTAIQDGEETVVHREHYLPDEDADSESESDSDA